MNQIAKHKGNHWNEPQGELLIPQSVNFNERIHALSLFNESLSEPIVEWYSQYEALLMMMVDHLVNHLSKGPYMMHQIVNHRGNHCDEPQGELLFGSVREL